MDDERMKAIWEVAKYYFYGLIAIFVCYTIFESTSKTNQEPVSNQPIFDTITVETLDIDTKIRIQRMTEIYDKDGKLSYDVTFRSEGFTNEFKCIIPDVESQKLNKDAIYTGTVTIGYLKELYNELVPSSNNTDSSTSSTSSDNSESIEDLVKKNKSSCEIINIDFLYTDYITDELKSIEDLTKEYTKLYMKDKNNEENKDNNT